MMIVKSSKLEILKISAKFMLFLSFLDRMEKLKILQRYSLSYLKLCQSILNH